QALGVALEMRVVVAEPTRRVELVNRVAALFADEQLGDRSGLDCMNRRVPGRQNIDRFVRAIAAPLREAAFDGVDVHAVDREPEGGGPARGRCWRVLIRARTPGS